jgi:hypothetical protein
MPVTGELRLWNKGDPARVMHAGVAHFNFVTLIHIAFSLIQRDRKLFASKRRPRAGAV